MNDSFPNQLGISGAGDSCDRTLLAADATNSETVHNLPKDTPSELTSSDFGLLDVIEAFTAMRHEWRTQTRENRELASAIHGASEKLLQLETKLDARSPIEQHGKQDGLRELVESIVEIDIHLNHAVDALVHLDRASSRSDLLTDLIRAEFENRGVISRWFCRRFFKSVLKIVANDRQVSAKDSTNEGLTMVVSRVRRIMSDRDIEPIETVGRRFDAATMHAIAAVESNQQQAGFVEEQISPAYFWRGELFRCADVRVAK